MVALLQHHTSFYDIMGFINFYKTLWSSRSQAKPRSEWRTFVIEKWWRFNFLSLVNSVGRWMYMKGIFGMCLSSHQRNLPMKLGLQAGHTLIGADVETYTAAGEWRDC